MTQMTNDRVIAIIEAYGADPSRWPEEERDAALATIERSGELTAYLSEARVVDAVLDLRQTDLQSVSLEQQILASAPEPQPAARSRSSRVRGGLIRRVLASGAAMACVSVGAVSGYAMTTASGTPSITDRADAYLAAGFDSAYDDSWWETDG